MGGLLKYLLILVVVGLVAWALGTRGRKPPLGGADASPAPAPRRRSGLKPQTMLACAHCRTHVPAAEALVVDGLPYCCEAHQRLGPRDGAA